MTTRRQLFRSIALAGASASALKLATAQTPAPKGPFTLPKLPYAFDALEPHIDARTMEIHHDRHHAGYVNNLNAAIAKHPELGRKSLDELVGSLSSIPEDIRTAVRNNGGGHINHSLFWQVMARNAGGQPKGELAKAIDKSFGSFASFKDQFSHAATGVFGSGWAWLGFDSARNLHIHSSPNQDNPWMEGHGALMGIDVWEHAYYLKYQNHRADYVKAWWNVVNWDFIASRYAKLKA